MKLSTINQVVEGIIAEGEAEYEIDIKPVVGWLKKTPTKEDFLKRWYKIANEATIYLKTAMICEDKGVDAAMDYFTGAHNEDEYKEFRTEVISGAYKQV